MPSAVRPDPKVADPTEEQIVAANIDKVMLAVPSTKHYWAAP